MTTKVVDKSNRVLFEVTDNTTIRNIKLKSIQGNPILKPEMIVASVSGQTPLVILENNATADQSHSLPIQLQTIFETFEQFKIKSERDISGNLTNVISKLYPEVTPSTPFLLRDVFRFLNFAPPRPNLTRVNLSWIQKSNIQFDIKTTINNLVLDKDIPFVFTRINNQTVVKFWKNIKNEAQLQIQKWILDDTGLKSAKGLTFRGYIGQSKIDPSIRKYGLLEVFPESGTIRAHFSFEDAEEISETDIHQTIIPLLNNYISRINSAANISIPKITTFPENSETTFSSSATLTMPFSKSEILLQIQNSNVFNIHENSKDNFILSTTNDGTLVSLNELGNNSVVSIQNAKTISEMKSIYSETISLFRESEVIFKKLNPANSADFVKCSDADTCYNDTFDKLPSALSEIFDANFFRTTSGGLLEAVSLALTEPASKIKQNMIGALKQSSLFETLNDGQLNSQFKTVQNYIRYIQTTRQFSYKSVLDLLSVAIKTNLFIFETKSSNVICDSSVFNFENDIYLLATDATSFQLVFHRDSFGAVTRVFPATTTISKRIHKLYHVSCLLTPHILGFSKPALSLFDIDQLGFNVVQQVTNASNKVMFVVLSPDNIVLPVAFSAPSPRLPTISINNTKFSSLETIFPILLELSEKNGLPFRPIGQVLDNVGKVESLVLESGLVLPVFPHARRLPTFAASVMEPPYPMEDWELNQSSDYQDSRIKTNFEFDYNQSVLKQMKSDLAELLSTKPQLRKEIEEVVMNRAIARKNQVLILETMLDSLFEEFHTIQKENRPTFVSSNRIACPSFASEDECLTNTLCSFEGNKCRVAIDSRNKEAFQKWIINDLLVDVSQKQILTNTIPIDNSTKGFVERPGEVILFSENDIREFVE